MAKEHFAIYAVNETDHWDQDVLAKHGIEAAFGLYLIRLGEAVHICSFTPSTRADFIENAFIFADPDADHESADELRTENGGERCTYFGYVDPRYVDKRKIGAPIIVNFDARNYKGGLRGDAYLDAIWDDAFEAANTNGAAYEPKILWREIYHAYEAEKAAKRRAENRPVLAGAMRGDALPLFSVAAQAEGMDYEKAVKDGWL